MDSNVIFTAGTDFSSSKPRKTLYIYVSSSNGSYFIENNLLSTRELIIPLQLYIDYLDITNLLGTPHKFTNWVLANVSPKNKLALHVIQLAILAKVRDVRRYAGYAVVLSPLLHDVHALEH